MFFSKGRSGVAPLGSLKNSSDWSALLLQQKPRQGGKKPSI
jgi:hypothetical protein